MERNNSVAPIFAWVILAVSILAVSSAGAVFQMISSVPPLLKASWRLQATSVILLPFAIYQYRNLDIKTKKLTLDNRFLTQLIMH